MGLDVMADVTSGAWPVFWAIIGVVWLVSLVVCIIKRHWVLFLIGWIFPMLWIVGACLPSRAPKRGASDQTAT